MLPNKFFGENLCCVALNEDRCSHYHNLLAFEISFGLISYKPARKPRLTPLMKAKRLVLAKEKHGAWTSEDCSEVMFSYKCTLKQFVVRKMNIRRPVGKRFQARYTVSSMTHPPSQLVWRTFSKSDSAGLCFLPPGCTVNSFRYVELLKEKPEIHMNTHQCIVFVRDGAPCHHSKALKQFLAENSLATLDWPGNSPDLNSIENLWETIESKIAKKQPSTVGALNQVVKEIWVKELSKFYVVRN